MPTPPHPDVQLWLPAGLDTPQAALWVSDPGGAMVFLNKKADSLMGRAGAFAGKNACGVPLCRNDCAVRILAHRQARIAPVRMRVPGAGGRWIQVLIFALTAPDGSYPWLVHRATDVRRTRRIERAA